MADGANDRIADLFTENALDLQRFDAGQRRAVRATLRELERDLVAQLTRADPAGAVRTATRQRRLERLLEQVRDTIRASYRRMSADLAGELRELADIEAEFAVRAINSGVGFDLATVELTRAQAGALASDVMVQGAPVKDWWSRQAGDTLERFTDQMRLGIAQGESNDRLVRRIRGGTVDGVRVEGFMDVTRRNAEALVRSATQAVAASAKDEAYRQNADILKGIAWLATLDTRTTVGCFPPSTSALPVGDLRGVFKRGYEGDLLVITTASGKQLRCTPNHPVLTARGWRPANELKPGADVLQRVVSDVVGVVPGKDIAMPATLGAISDALLKVSAVDVAVERSTEADFHGDGQAGFYEIHRTRADSDLGLKLESSGFHEVAESLFVGVALSARFATLGHADAAFLAGYFGDEAAKFDPVPFEHGVKPGLGDAELAADVAGLHAIRKGLNDPPFIGALKVFAAPEGFHDARALEDASDSGGGDIVSLGDFAGRGAVSIVSDNVVSVECEFFAGHVYNLSTDTEFYIADGFIVHNCAARDGLLYTVGDHRPIDHDLPWDGGPGNRHWGALAEGSLIRTESGLTPIENIRSGDKVLTHDGSWSTVSATMRKRAQHGIMRVAHMKSGRVLRATYDHPVWTVGSGWVFMGRLQVGDKMRSDAYGMEEIIGASRLVVSEPENGPAAFDQGQIAIKRTIQFVAAKIGFKCSEDVGPREIEDRAISMVLADPVGVYADQSALHHHFALAHVLGQVGLYRLRAVLTLLNCPRAAVGFSKSLIKTVAPITLNHTRKNFGVFGWIPFSHALRVARVIGMGLFGMPKGPMAIAGRVNDASGINIEPRLLFLRADGDGVPLGVGPQRAVGQSLFPLDAAEGKPVPDVSVFDKASKARVSLGHDEVLSIGVQTETPYVYDLEVQGNSSYFANGVAVSNCRSTSYPVTKSWRELGIDVDDLPPGTRASMDGKAPADTRFEAWLERQSRERQEAVLGPGRAELWRENKLTFRDLVDGTGRELSVEELRARVRD